MLPISKHMTDSCRRTPEKRDRMNDTHLYLQYTSRGSAARDKLCVHTTAGESIKSRSGRPANDAVERFVDALTIARLVLYLKEPKRKQAC